MLSHATTTTTRYPTLTPGALHGLFATFDVDNSGDIDLQEFTIGLSRSVGGSLSQKLEMLFNVFDKDGDNVRLQFGGWGVAPAPTHTLSHTW